MSTPATQSREELIEVLGPQWRTFVNTSQASLEHRRMRTFVERLCPGALPIHGDDDLTSNVFWRRDGWTAPFMPCRTNSMDLDHLKILFFGQMIEVTYEEYVEDYVAPLIRACKYPVRQEDMRNALNFMKALNRPAQLTFAVSAAEFGGWQAIGMLPGLTRSRAVGIDLVNNSDTPAAMFSAEVLVVPADRTEMGCDGDNGVYLASVDGDYSCVFVRHYEDGRKGYTTSGYVSRRLREALEHAGYTLDYNALIGVKFRKINSYAKQQARPRHFLFPAVPTFGHAVVTNRKMKHIEISADKLKNNVQWSGVLYC